MRTRFTSALLLIAYLWPATGMAALAHLTLAHGRACDEHAATTAEFAARSDHPDETDSASCLVCAQLHQFKRSAGLTPVVTAALDNRTPGPLELPCGDPIPQGGRIEPIQARAPPFLLD